MDKKFKIILVNIVLIGIALSLSYVIFNYVKYRAINHRMAASDYFESCDKTETDELKPFKILPNANCTGYEKKHNIITRVIKIGIDSLGFRKTPDNYNKNKPSIVFSGCSFVFGYRLEDKETLPWKISELTHRKVYNVAYNGNGPQHLLLDFQSDDFSKKINNADAFIYLFIQDHIRRLKSPTNINDPFFYPTYNLAKDGTLIKNTPSEEYIKASSEQRIKLKQLSYIKNTGHEIKNKELRELLLAVMKETEREIKKYNPNARFIILEIYDNADVDKFFRDNGFELITFHDLTGEYLDTERYVTLHDHPNHKLWEYIAPKLVQKLKL